MLSKICRFYAAANKVLVRELRMPTKAEVEAAGGKLGFNIKGGAEHNSPIIISKVEPGT